ncbi:MAG: hypothetical protein HC876_19960 [Chloroflexaceae bacterium]|nr:hypothetical protein [Chloroflexaceae bacterium]NJO07601.1 hypothetical protein [Chloroflexaceae bacterium]
MRIYLPTVIGGTSTLACAPEEREAAIAEQMHTHPDQGRATMSCHPILEEVAREMAADMATRNYFDHINPEGLGPNELVRMAGYPLDSGYDTALAGNNIQSIGGGVGSPDTIWNAWMGSAIHKTHLLGQSDFYATQTDYGVGYYYAPESEYKHYWVVITARQDGQ